MFTQLIRGNIVANNNITGYVTDTIFNKVISIIGTSYDSRTINYHAGYPQETDNNEEGMFNNLPLVFMESAKRSPVQQYEQGGDREYEYRLFVHIIAGGLDDDSQNELMKLDLGDRLFFGFDDKTYHYHNSTNGKVEGIYNTNIIERDRIITNNADTYGKHHAEFVITAKVLRNNNN